MDRKEIREKIDEGYFYCNVSFEIVGNPKEHVEKAIRLLIQKIKEIKKLIITKESYGEAVETPDKLWSTYADTEMLIKDFSTLNILAMNFAPASIEIKEPKQVVMKQKDIADLYSEILAATHEANMKLVQANSERKQLLLNINALVRNAVLVSIANKIDTAAEIGKRIGIKGKDLDAVLDAMIKEGKIIKKGNKYERKPTQ